MAQIGTIGGKGIYAGDVLSLLTLIRTNFLAVTAKLDADSGVSGTNFGSIWNFALPDPNLFAAAGGYRDQGVLLDYMKTIRTSYVGLLAKLDLDGGVADTDFAALETIASSIDTGTNLADLNQAGVNQGAVAKWFDTFVTKWNALLTKLDADGTVNDTNFNSLWSISAALVSSGTGNLLKVGG